MYTYVKKASKIATTRTPCPVCSLINESTMTMRNPIRKDMF
jgi:hypothetical protein